MSETKNIKHHCTAEAKNDATYYFFIPKQKIIDFLRLIQHNTIFIVKSTLLYNYGNSVILMRMSDFIPDLNSNFFCS